MSSPYPSTFTFSSTWSLKSGVHVPVSVRLAALCCCQAISRENFTLDQLQDDNSIHWAVWAHQAQSKLKYITRSSVWLLIALTFLERPRWCSSAHAPSCADPFYFTYGVYLDDSWFLVIESFACMVLAFSLVLTTLVLGIKPSVESLRINFDILLRVVLMLALALDIILIACSLTTLSRWRPAPYFRILLCALQNRSTVLEARLFLYGLKEFLRMLFFLEVFVLIGAWFGVTSLIAHHEHFGFNNLGDAFWELQVLLTTNNFPNIMMVGYTKHRFVGVFFVIYLMIGFFLLLPMVMSVVYQGYKTHGDELKTYHKATKKKLLDRAFHVLDEEEVGALNKQQVVMFLHELGRIRGNLDILDDCKRSMIFGLLDQSGDGLVDEDEFMRLVKVLTLKFQHADQTPLLKRFAPQVWLALNNVLVSIPESVFDLSLVAYGALLVHRAWPLILDSHAEMRSDWYSIYLLNVASGLFILEVLMKVLVLGWHGYLVSWRCVLDVTAIAGVIIARAYTILHGHSDDMWVHLAMNFRMVRVFRLLYRLPGFDHTFKSFLGLEKAARRILPFYCTIFMLFNILGCDLFGGLITKDPAQSAADPLAKTDYGIADFYALNFNDRPSGAMLLFACLVLNNFSVYVDAFVLVSSVWARVFFWSFWVCGILSGWNFVMAVMIDAVVGELSKDETESLKHRKSVLLPNAEVISGTNTGAKGAYFITRRRTEADELSEDEDDESVSLSCFASDGEDRAPPEDRAFFVSQRIKPIRVTL